MADCERDGSEARPPGRPASIDPERIAAAALRLFAENGYEGTSMEDIARAARIGRKSLYRYFASKAELVWGGTEPVRQVIAAGLAPAAGLDDKPGTAGGGEPGHNGTVEEGELRCRLLSAVTAAADSLPDPEVTRGRLRLIGAYPELAARGYSYQEQNRGIIARYLESSGVPGAKAQLAAAALAAALLTAWIQWAESEDSTPEPYLAAALDVLRLV